MTIRHVAVLALATLGFLWNALPALKGSGELDRALGGSGASVSRNDKARVLHLNRDEFVSLTPATTDSVQSGSGSWIWHWTTPAWGDLPARAWRATSAAASGANQVRLTDNEVIAVIFVTWSSLLAVFAGRAWIEKGV